MRSKTLGLDVDMDVTTRREKVATLNCSIIAGAVNQHVNMHVLLWRTGRRHSIYMYTLNYHYHYAVHIKPTRSCANPWIASSWKDGNAAGWFH